MNEYSTINKTAEAAGPLADLEAVERVRDGIVKAATQHWHCHIMERSNLDTCAEHNARSHNGGNCGLHIHVSRTWLDTDDKVTTFIRLVQGHAAEWQVFSRRNLDNMSYCRLESDFQSGISLGDSPAEKRRKTYRKTGHHTAINCENSATFELRLWRGTLVKQTLRATIEATAAMALIAGDYLTDVEALESWSWRDLVKQMVKALDRYKLPSADLLAYLQARNL